MCTVLHPPGRLPTLGRRLFLTDGGVETTLIFHDGWELPLNAAFVLLERPEGRSALRAYYERFIPLALERSAGFVLESPTWRSNRDWGARLGYDARRLAAVNRDAVALMKELRSAHETVRSPMAVSGCIGPRGDGYDAGLVMSIPEATGYHAWQTDVFAEAGVDLVTATTMTNVNEAIGVARAARMMNVPSVISFTLEIDGRLPTGEPLRNAIDAVDQSTGGAPAYYMLNCAHPSHFDRVLDEGAAWTQRIRGIRANASRCSHKELDESPTLDIGNPMELGEEYAELLWRFPQISVLGGCCGTDHRHVAAISEACMARV